MKPALLVPFILTTPTVASSAVQGLTIEGAILEAIKQAPALGILVLVISLFLRAMRDRDKQLTDHAMREEAALHEVAKVLGDLREDLARKGKV